jgi:hypothetical protein
VSDLARWVVGLELDSHGLTFNGKHCIVRRYWYAVGTNTISITLAASCTLLSIVYTTLNIAVQKLGNTGMAGADSPTGRIQVSLLNMLAQSCISSDIDFISTLVLGLVPIQIMKVYSRKAMKRSSALRKAVQPKTTPPPGSLSSTPVPPHLRATLLSVLPKLSILSMLTRQIDPDVPARSAHLHSCTLTRFLTRLLSPKPIKLADRVLCSAFSHW